MWQCPNCCKPHVDTPFIYPGHTFCPQQELGVLAYKDLSSSNRWEDGTAGVPQWIHDQVSEGDNLPHCIECGAEVA
jgi:hypothetical protein